MELTFHRSGGALKSVDITVGSTFANASMEIEVFHASAADLARPRHVIGPTGASGPTGHQGPTGENAGLVEGTIVYVRQVSGAPPRSYVGPTGGIGGPKIPAWAKVTGASTWSGTLYTSDWDGGCAGGEYWIRVIAVRPGTSLADAVSGKTADRESFGTGRFSCNEISPKRS